MAQVINKVKVTCDYDNGRDKNFIFTLSTDGTEADTTKIVNKILKQKLKEGELDKQNLRSITINSDDERGFFSSFAGDVQDFLNDL